MASLYQTEFVFTLHFHSSWCTSVHEVCFIHAEAEADRARRAGRGAFAAADALRGLRGLCRIDVHRTDARALAAAHAFGFIHRQAVEGDLVE